MRSCDGSHRGMVRAQHKGTIQMQVCDSDLHAKLAQRHQMHVTFVCNLACKFLLTLSGHVHAYKGTFPNPVNLLKLTRNTHE
jgi:hypothetical protein